MIKVESTSATRKGGRPATGAVEFHGGRWRARVSIPGEGRKWLNLPETLGTGDEAAARKLAKRLSKRVRQVTVVPVERLETVAEWSPRWLTERETNGLASAPEDKRTLSNHVLPAIGARAIVDVSSEDLRLVVRSLDEKVRAGTIAWKTASNIWVTVRAMFRDACKSKNDALRVRNDNPAQNVQGPDRGDAKAMQYLYPSEFLALVSCEKVPLHWRRLYAVAVYLGARAGELSALKWNALDLEHESVHVHQSIDRKRSPKKTRGTKTKRARRFELERALVPLLEAMRDEVKDTAGEDIGALAVVRLPSMGVLSSQLKEHLQRAGVTREELFARESTRRPIRFHDARASCLTWMAVRGDNPLVIRQRAGHGGLAMTEKYIREAESLRGEAFGTPFPELPRELLTCHVVGRTEPSVRVLSPEGVFCPQSEAKTSRNSVGGTGFEPATSGL